MDLKFSNFVLQDHVKIRWGSASIFSTDSRLRNAALDHKPSSDA